MIRIVLLLLTMIMPFSVSIRQNFLLKKDVMRANSSCWLPNRRGWCPSQPYWIDGTLPKGHIYKFQGQYGSSRNQVFSLPIFLKVYNGAKTRSYIYKNGTRYTGRNITSLSLLRSLVYIRYFLSMRSEYFSEKRSRETCLL